MRARSLWASVLFAAVVCGPAGAQTSAGLKKVGFTDADLASLAKGEAIAKLLPTKDDNDAAVIGAIHIAAQREALIEQVRKIDQIRTGMVLQAGRFSTPPKLEDLAGLTFDEDDLKDFQECKPGSCDIKLGAGAMEIATKVDWKAKDAHAQASALLKQAMVDGANAYLNQGVLGLYVDNKVPEPVIDGLRKILEDSPYLLEYDATFSKYMLEFPKSNLPNTESILYWSKDKLRKPVVSISHLVIYKRGEGAATNYLIGRKHVYDSHYFLANVDFASVVPDADPAKGLSLVYLNRTRIDPPQHFRGTLLGKIKGGMKDAMADKLRTIKARLESAPPGPR
jgi:hypothetical protein